MKMVKHQHLKNFKTINWRFEMIKYLLLASLVLVFASCSKKEIDPMKECMKTMSHMQCVDKLSKE